MTLFGAQRRQWTPEPIVPPFPGASMLSSSQSMDSALRLSAVWASVRLLADSVSMMPLHAYTVRNGQRVPIADPPLIVEPAFGTTMSDWIYMLMVSALLRGNAYGVIVARDGYGYPTQIELVNPDTVQVRRDSEGIVRYTVAGVARDRDEMFHLPAYRIPGQPVGLSPVAYAARTLTTVAAAEKFGEGFFLEGAHPTAVITTDTPLNTEMARQMKDRVIASVKGREPAVLGAGAKWQAMQIAPEESQFLETQKFGVSQIARVFGVPPEMIGGASDGTNITYANVTQRSMDFLTYSVQPWLTRIEQALFPLLPNARHVRFDTSVLVRLDAETQAKVDDFRLNGGVKTINEARLPLDMPPVAWGDEPYLPGMKTSAAAAALKPAPVAEQEPPTAEGEPDDGSDDTD